jgi:hypothetical protein
MMKFKRDHRATFPGNAFTVAHSQGNKQMSLTFGAKKVIGTSGDCITDDTDGYKKEVKQVLEWAKMLLRDNFTFTSFIVLENTECEVHGDWGNIGVSAIITVGDHTGGQLWVSDGNGGKVLYCHNTVHYFDPRTCHRTMPWKGKNGDKGARYSIVFYTSGGANRLYKPDYAANRKELEDLGFFAIPVQSQIPPQRCVSKKEQSEHEAAANVEYERFKCVWDDKSKTEQWKCRRSVDM